MDNATSERPNRRVLSDTHKAALAEGRREGAIVRQYLEALSEYKPKRGRKPSIEGMRSKLAEIEKQLPVADPAHRLFLIQERMDLQERLEMLENASSLTEIEEEFASVVADYSARKGITYQAWREFGVPAEVLRKGGLDRKGGLERKAS